MSTPSPRRLLLDAMGECLQRITVANGFLTDLGLAYTREPGQIDGAVADAAVTAFISKQARPDDPNLVRFRRETTVTVIARLPSAQQQEQDVLDRIVSDVELAFDRQFTRFPTGIPFPQYLAMEPLKPPSGAGWIGAVFTFTTNIPIT